MIKKLSISGTILFASSLFLTACGFNPQTSSVSKKQQCLTLQHQMVFANGFNSADASDFQYQNNQQSLQQQFQKLHCYQVLEKARKSQPEK